MVNNLNEKNARIQFVTYFFEIKFNVVGKTIELCIEIISHELPITARGIFLSAYCVKG